MWRKEEVLSSPKAKKKYVSLLKKEDAMEWNGVHRKFFFWKIESIDEVKYFFLWNIKRKKLAHSIFGVEDSYWRRKADNVLEMTLTFVLQTPTIPHTHATFMLRNTYVFHFWGEGESFHRSCYVQYMQMAHFSFITEAWGWDTIDLCGSGMSQSCTVLRITQCKI